ncbi:hypothetical protein B484DRAFT_478969, partial [Ochromonadaceae sp. CCMP2298]
MVRWLLRILLVTCCVNIRQWGALAASSTCVLPNGSKVTGSGDCSTGEVWLLGNYVNLGVHNAASWGTASQLVSAYYTRKLGIIADYDRNGWGTNQGTPASPNFSGDFFIPGIALEGWLVNYAAAGSSVNAMNMGLIPQVDVATKRLVVTSNADHQSVLWVGTSGVLQISKVVHLDNDKLYFATSVQVKNIGSATVTDFFYTRTIDPDQEKTMYGPFETQNYVNYQPTAIGEAAYVNENNGNTALVVAVGKTNYDFFLGMGTVNSRAKVAHFSNFMNNGATVMQNNAWKSFGGKDMQPSVAYSSRMKYADESLHLTYSYATIEPGEVVTFEYTHILHQSEQTEALGQLESVLMMQPIDTLSGSAATLSVEIKITTAVTSCTFYLFAAASGSVAAWHQVATVSAIAAPTYGNSAYMTASARVDTTQFSDGVGELRVRLSTSSGVVVYRKSKAVWLQNTGLQLCFQQSDLNGLYPISRGTDLSLVLGYCAGASGSYSLLGASFFLERVSNDEVGSSLLGSIGAAQSLPYTLTISAAQLSTPAVGSTIAIKMAVSSSAGSATYSTSAVFMGSVVNVPTNQPTPSPSVQPSFQPSTKPTAPSARPTASPSLQPTVQPSAKPSTQPSTQPSAQPSTQPSAQPSTQPSGQPSSQPSGQPSSQPSGQPSSQPTMQP